VHYPNTNKNDTSYLVSWYLAHGCIRPANNSNAVPGMCQSRLGWSPLDVHSLLQEAEAVNSAVPGFNNAVTHPSATTTVVTAGTGVMTSGSPFMLLVFAMILSIFGWLAFWLCPRRLFIVPLGFLVVAMTFGVGAAAWLKISAEQAKSHLESIDPQYARGARIGSVFMGLLWSVAVALILSFLSAVVAIWLNLRDEEYGALKQNVNEEDYVLE